MDPNPATSFGQMFIGLLVATILFGITNLQTFIYYTWYPCDNLWTKLSVAWLWILDAFHMFLCSHIVYHYLVDNYMNPQALLTIVWSFKAEICIVCVVTVLVQTMYAVRIWKLALRVKDDRGQRVVPYLQWILPPVVSGLVLLEYGVMAAVIWAITRVNTWEDLIRPQEYWMAYLPLGSACGIDIVITVSLCYLLGRCRTGFGRTDTAVNALMRYVVETGLITALSAAAAIIINASNPVAHGFAMLSVEFVLSKLYINCFLAMLNARSALSPVSSESDGGLSMANQAASYVYMNQGSRLSYTQQYIRPLRAADRRSAQEPVFVAVPPPVMRAGRSLVSPTYGKLADLATHVTEEKYEWASGLTVPEPDSPVDPHNLSPSSYSGSSLNYRRPLSVDTAI